MAADDELMEHSDQHTILLDEAWTKLRRAWRRVGRNSWSHRLALHLAFLFVVLAGLWMGRTVVSDNSAPTIVVSPPPTLSANTHCPQSEEPVGGIGGETADLLLCAVVPHTTIPRRYRIDPITYTVQTGDNVSSIAEQFGVSVETLLWNNGNLEDNPDYLGLGDVLTILPVSGVYHTVVEDDTLESIAQQYKANVEDIISFEGNYLQEPYTITIGQRLIVPGGHKPYKVRHVVFWSGEIPAGAKRGTGIFGWPMPRAPSAERGYLVGP